MTHNLLIVFGAFAASAVEMVEAATIVLAVGITYSWRASLWGVIGALGALAIVVAGLGPALVNYVPLNVLQLVIGSLLLAFGLQWLRKAVQRAAHVRSDRDEDAIYAREIGEMRAARQTQAGDSQVAGFLISFKGVFLEGLEVAFIVLTFGAASDSVAVASAGALAAAAFVAIAAVAAHRPLAKVPENTIKFTVGLLLITFGTFWGGEGAGIEWFAGDVTLLVLLAGYTAAAYLTVSALNARARKPKPQTQPAGAAQPDKPLPWWSPVAFGRFWYDFLIGDSATLAVGTAVCILAGWALAAGGAHGVAEAVMPATTLSTLEISLFWQ